MNIQGKIKMIGETQTFGSNGFRKRDLVVTTQEQYPQHILTEFVQDKCDILDGYNVSEEVEVGVNLRGREWVNPQGETKYFNSIQGWRIERKPLSAVDQHEAKSAPMSQVPDNQEDTDDLPF